MLCAVFHSATQRSTFMRFCFSGALVMAAVLALSPASFAQGSAGNVKEAQAALENAKERVKQAEAALKQAHGHAKEGESRRGPQRRRPSSSESRRGPQRRGPQGGPPSKEEFKKRMEMFQKAMKERIEKGGAQGRRPSSEEIKKRMEAFQKAMKDRMEHHKAAHSKEGAGSRGKGPGDHGSRFGRGPHGRPGFGPRGPGGPGRPGFASKRPGFKPGPPDIKGRPGPGPHKRPSKDAKSGKRPSIEARLDKLAKEIEAIRRELKR
jgi:hypothetical protein